MLFIELHLREELLALDLQGECFFVWKFEEKRVLKFLRRGGSRLIVFEGEVGSFLNVFLRHMAAAVDLDWGLRVRLEHSLLRVAADDLLEPFRPDLAGRLGLAPGGKRGVKPLSNNDLPRLGDGSIVDKEAVVAFQVAEDLV